MSPYQMIEESEAAALRTQAAKAELPDGYVKMPQSHREAEAMLRLASMFLGRNTAAPTQTQEKTE